METEAQRGLVGNKKSHCELFKCLIEFCVPSPHHFAVNIGIFLTSCSILKWPIKSQNYDQRNEKMVKKGCIRVIRLQTALFILGIFLSVLSLTSCKTWFITQN